MPKKRVIAFGTFDLLHPGHKYYLKQAKLLGRELVVIVARESNAKLFGKNPHHSEAERLKAVADLDFVNKAVMGEEGDTYNSLRKFRPDVVALGYDQVADEERIAKTLTPLRITPEIVRIPAYKKHKYKTSKIKENLRSN